MGPPTGDQVRRIFTPEEKADIVRQADEAGVDRHIQQRHHLAQGTIGRWRREGYGRKLHTGSTGSVIERATNSRTTYPSLRCPSCADRFAIPGTPTNLNRLRAWERHYEDSPGCLVKNKRRAS